MLAAIDGAGAARCDDARHHRAVSATISSHEPPGFRISLPVMRLHFESGDFFDDNAEVNRRPSAQALRVSIGAPSVLPASGGIIFLLGESALLSSMFLAEDVGMAAFIAAAILAQNVSWQSRDAAWSWE